MTTRIRWTITIVLAAALLALAAGVAYAATRPTATASQQGGATTASQACQQLHDSTAMRQMRARMPAQARQQHDAMHQKMQQNAGQMMGGAGMMQGGTSGGGMMSGSIGSGMMSGGVTSGGMMQAR